jgi:hypothetical protein
VTDYGVYGLLVGTVGLAASVAGLQMGLTATVFIARYRTHDKAKARFAIQFANRRVRHGATFLLAALFRSNWSAAEDAGRHAWSPRPASTPCCRSSGSRTHVQVRGFRFGRAFGSR